MKTFIVVFALFCVAAARRDHDHDHFGDHDHDHDHFGDHDHDHAGIRDHRDHRLRRDAAHEIPIVKMESDVGFDGSYRNFYETGNKIIFQEQGVLKNLGQKDAEAEEVQGSYQYTAPDGQVIALKYIANENGFQPEGAHLPVAPTPPPIPAQIARALEWIAAHPVKETIERRL